MSVYAAVEACRVSRPFLAARFCLPLSPCGFLHFTWLSARSQQRTSFFGCALGLLLPRTRHSYLRSTCFAADNGVRSAARAHGITLLPPPDCSFARRHFVSYSVFKAQILSFHLTPCLSRGLAPPPKLLCPFPLFAPPVAGLDFGSQRLLRSGRLGG